MKEDVDYDRYIEEIYNLIFTCIKNKQKTLINFDIILTV